VTARAGHKITIRDSLGNAVGTPTVPRELRRRGLQSLVEWSDNHTVGEVLRRKGSIMERLVTSLGEVL
jgi:hypothetical protein